MIIILMLTNPIWLVFYVHGDYLGMWLVKYPELWRCDNYETKILRTTVMVKHFWWWILSIINYIQFTLNEHTVHTCLVKYPEFIFIAGYNIFLSVSIMQQHWLYCTLLKYKIKIIPTNNHWHVGLKVTPYFIFKNSQYLSEYFLEKTFLTVYYVFDDVDARRRNYLCNTRSRARLSLPLQVAGLRILKMLVFPDPFFIV